MFAELDPFWEQVLHAVIAGYRAREGMKERTRALSEYELARRLGLVGGTYADFEFSEQRQRLADALGELQRRGLLRGGSPSGRYETFIPAPDLEISVAEGGGAEAEEAGQHAAGHALSASLERISLQLDAIARLLRSIDRKLGPDTED